MTVEQYMLYWLDTYKKRKLAGRTYDSYLETIKVHIATDQIGSKLFDRLTPDDIQKYYNRKLDQGLSGTTVLYHHRILHAAYNQAFKSRLIPWGMNPCAAVEPPRKDEHDPVILTTDNIEFILANTIFQEYKDNGKIKKLPSLKLPIIIASMTGTRAGEACALQWPDINRELMGVHIDKTVKREQNQLVIGPTKNKKERWAPLTHGFLRILDWHKARQDAHIEMYNSIYGEGSYNDQGFIFAQVDGSHFDPHYLSDSLPKVLKGIGFKKEATFHAFRHFYASAMHNKGANDKMITDALGHGGKMHKTTEIYVHSQLDAMRPFVDWLDEAILKGVLKEIDANKSANKR